MLMQGSQVIAPVIAANLQGVTISELESVGTMPLAFYYSYAAIVIITFAMALGSSGLPFAVVLQNSLLIRKLNPKRMLWAFVPAFLFSVIAGRFAFGLGGLAQPLLALGSVHLVLAFLVFIAALDEPVFRKIAVFVLVLEVLYGFLGFFSGFKTILYLLLVVLTSRYSNPLKLLRWKFVFPLAFLLVLLTFWQVVKVEYRSLANQGSSSQEVSIGLERQVDFYLASASRFGIESIGMGFDSGLARLGYLHFFATSMTQVPSIIPHQAGRLWEEAIQVILQPRLLFPDKPPINDSDRTNQFSGVLVSGADKGTSISIGYVGESFIDFGFPLMLAPVSLMGVAWGWFYRFLCSYPPITPLGSGFATVLILVNAISFEQSNLKLLPGTIICVLIFWIFLKFYGRLTWLWLIGE